MPTYTYECKTCLSTQDVFHGIAERRQVRCTTCGELCERLFGVGAGVIFKGSSLYETDYKGIRNDNRAGKPMAMTLADSRRVLARFTSETRREHAATA